jgi:hypothetical protein
MGAGYIVVSSRASAAGRCWPSWLQVLASVLLLLLLRRSPL